LSANSGASAGTASWLPQMASRLQVIAFSDLGASERSTAISSAALSWAGPLSSAASARPAIAAVSATHNMRCFGLSIVVPLVVGILHFTLCTLHFALAHARVPSHKSRHGSRSASDRSRLASSSPMNTYFSGSKASLRFRKMAMFVAWQAMWVWQVTL
jgi:hypothetical protein